MEVWRCLGAMGITVRHAKIDEGNPLRQAEQRLQQAAAVGWEQQQIWSAHWGHQKLRRTDSETLDGGVSPALLPSTEAQTAI